MNDFYTYASGSTAHTRARASEVDTLGQAVETAFDKLPGASLLNQGRVTYALDSGAANAYVIALPQTLTAYETGMTVWMKCANANTGPATINIDGLGVKPITRTNGDVLSANDITVDQVIALAYDGTNFRFTGATSADVDSAAASASAASLSASGAATSANSASTSAANAVSSAAAASTSETNAGTSETNAAASASAASTSQTNAGTSETNAAASASAASTSQTNAGTSATNAATSETNAATSETNAATSETNAAASYDSFDDRYLGAKTVAPTLDNDGNALITGALYWNTPGAEMNAWDGAAWQVAYVPVAGLLSAANNLSDLNSAATARTNLGLGSIATQAASAVAITGGTAAGLTGLAMRSTGAAFDLTFASAEVLTAGRTLSIDVGDAARTLTIAANATVSDTNTGDQTITLTGDVTGTGSGSFAATIANSAVSLAKIADISTARMLGRNTGGTGVVEELTASTARSVMGLGSLATQNNVNNGDWSGTDLAISNGGTGASNASAARDALGGNAAGARTVSTLAPSGGSNGDVWYRY